MSKKRVKRNNSMPKSTTGFAILFAVLTASLLMSIGISIFGISIKELSLSTASESSQIAFYAADSARECALYWDIKVGAFKTYTDSSGNTNTPPTSSIVVCNGNSINLSDSSVTTMTKDSSTHNYSYSFLKPFFSFSSTNILSPEAGLTITKTYVSSGGYIDTLISTYGHNIGINAGKRIERGLGQEIINNK